MEGGEGFHGEDNDVRPGQEETGFEEIGVVSDKFNLPERQWYVWRKDFQILVELI